MKPKDILISFVYFLIFSALQVFLFLNLSLFGCAFCYIYLGFLLILPIETPRLILMLIGMAAGLIIDIFYDTLGIHTAACILVAFLRPHIINILTPRGGYDTGSEVSFSSLGFQWVVTYSTLLIFIHHIALFFVESWGFHIFFFTLLKALCSTLFTLTVFLLFQYLFYSPRGYK
ncbi:MAG: Rod shape-determining protein MreD [Cytophagaceae bacterium]